MYVNEGARVRKFSSVLIIYNMNEYEVYMTIESMYTQQVTLA